MTLARRFPHLKPFLDHDGGSPDFWQIAVLDLGLLSSNRERTHSFQVVTMNYKLKKPIRALKSEEST